MSFEQALSDAMQAYEQETGARARGHDHCVTAELQQRGQPSVGSDLMDALAASQSARAGTASRDRTAGPSSHERGPPNEQSRREKFVVLRIPSRPQRIARVRV